MHTYMHPVCLIYQRLINLWFFKIKLYFMSKCFSAYRCKVYPESLTQGDEFFHLVKRLLILLGNHWCTSLIAIMHYFFAEMAVLFLNSGESSSNPTEFKKTTTHAHLYPLYCNHEYFKMLIMRIITRWV